MIYSFELYKYTDKINNTEKTSPLLKIEDDTKYGCYFVDEISNLSQNYLHEIVAALEQVLSGRLEQYDFGYEVYLIECKKETSNVVDTFEDWKLISEIYTQELYELMRDWRNFLVEHNK